MPLWESLAIACVIAVGSTGAYSLAVASAEYDSALNHAAIRAEWLETQVQTAVELAEQQMAERLISK
jgi:ATP-dependent protease HslVU (ClpYQ) peptidase subunit